MDAGYGRDYRFLVMDNVNEQSSPAFDSAAVDSERGTRNPTYVSAGTCHGQDFIMPTHGGGPTHGVGGRPARERGLS